MEYGKSFLIGFFFSRTVNFYKKNEIECMAAFFKLETVEKLVKEVANNALYLSNISPYFGCATNLAFSFACIKYKY